MPKGEAVGGLDPDAGAEIPDREGDGLAPVLVRGISEQAGPGVGDSGGVSSLISPGYQSQKWIPAARAESDLPGIAIGL